MTSPSTQDPLLTASGVTKAYGRVQALRGVDLVLERQQISALVGDNGAGKSTFVAALSGATPPDAGTITLDGAPISGASIAEAMRAGIAAVYQDLAVAPHLSAAENIFLSMETRRRGFLGRIGAVDHKAMRDEAGTLMTSLGIQLPSMDTPVQDLSGGQRQVVALARGVSRAGKLIILDEPTASLGPKQSAIVADVISATRDRGLSVLLVSHDLPAVIAIADTIHVMRQGRLVATIAAIDATVTRIVSLMLGESVEEDSL